MRGAAARRIEFQFILRADAGSSEAQTSNEAIVAAPPMIPRQARDKLKHHSGVIYAAVIPPSTRNVDPFTYDDSSLARNNAAFAISSGRAKRPGGMCTSRRLRRAGSASSSCSSGVSTGPGQSAFARMFLRANSTAISRVIDSTPPLLAVYAICGAAAPITATNDAVLMIDPPPARNSAGIAYLHPKKTPLRFTLIVRSQAASGVSTTDASSL